MKKQIFALAVGATLCALFTACDTSGADSDGASMSVATYNLRLDINSDSVAGNGWGKRARHVADVVRYHEFDIFGTQEGLRHMLNDLKDSLPGYDYIGTSVDDTPDGAYNAIFYDTDKFRLIEHGDFWLSETPDSVSYGWDAAYRRICTWGKFLHKKANIPFLYFNLHMDHIGKVARTESAKLILNKISDLHESMPVILSGDFNIDQTDPGYKQINESGIMKDAFELAQLPYITTSTYNDFNPNGMFVTSQGHPARIDHIFLTPQHFNVKKYGVLTDTYRDIDAEGNVISRTPSDHFPVKIDVEISN